MLEAGADACASKPSSQHRAAYATPSSLRSAPADLQTYVTAMQPLLPMLLLLLLLLQPTAEARHGVLEAFKTEVQLLSACRDPHIVSFLGASLSGDFTLLVTEYCEGGSLAGNLGIGRVNWQRRGKQVRQLLLPLALLLMGQVQLHSQPHGELRSYPLCCHQVCSNICRSCCWLPVLLLY